MMQKLLPLLILSWPAVSTHALSTMNHVIRRPSSSSTAKYAEREATFGMGCFWEPSESLLEVDGVVDTVVGYTGNPSATQPPSYHTVCNGREWVEAVRVTYDDDQLSFPDLLDAFFENQKPQVGSRQYESMIFYNNIEEKDMAENWVQQDKVRNDGLRPRMTTLEQSSPFYQAEGYHQRFWQKQRPRFAVGVFLLAVASGLLDPIVPEQFQDAIQTTANAGYVVGALGMLLERKLDAKVVESS